MSLQDYLLQRLKTSNPQGYKAFTEIKDSGRDPYDVLREMYSDGEINDSQLDAIVGQMRLFGVSISQEDMGKIKTGGQRRGYKGLF